MKYFEDNPEIFAALVAAIAILGGLLGSVIGAKIQASGGRDQAAAAREAAQIAAEAQRNTDLWAVRQLQTAEFIHGVRKVVLIHGSFYRQDSSDGVLLAELTNAEQALLQKEAEIELVAPQVVVAAAKALRESVFDAGMWTVGSAPSFFVQGKLDALRNSNELDDRLAAARAIEGVEELRSISKCRPLSVVERDRAERQAYHVVSECTGLSGKLVVEALYGLGSGMSDTMQEQRRVDEEIEERAEALVTAARHMLKSEDNVAPTVPQQRRRWWRAA
ncbi:hypothetical protein [Streptomyces gardneri]|uniref:hypothetical protein n=1 Tax=Streptomyces gardneri TaxID=66892 RepID=UPI0035E36C5F